MTSAISITRARRITAATFAALALALIPIASAEAYSVSRSGTTGGAYNLKKTVGTWDQGGAQVHATPLTACAAPGYSGSQRITVTYGNWKKVSGSWKPFGYVPWSPWQSNPTVTRTRNVAAGGCASFTGAYWEVDLPDYNYGYVPYGLALGGGLMGTDIVVQWNKYTTGAYLGEMVIDYDQAGDYQCGGNDAARCWVMSDGLLMVNR